MSDFVIRILIQLAVSLLGSALLAIVALTVGGTGRLRKSIAADQEIFQRLTGVKAKAELQRSISDRTMVLLSRVDHPRLLGTEAVICAVGLAIAAQSTIGFLWSSGSPPSDRPAWVLARQALALIGLLWVAVVGVLAARVRRSVTARGLRRAKFVLQHVRSTQTAAAELVSILFWAKGVVILVVLLGTAWITTLVVIPAEMLVPETYLTPAAILCVLCIPASALTLTALLRRHTPVADFVRAAAGKRDPLGQELLRHLDPQEAAIFASGSARFDRSTSAERRARTMWQRLLIAVRDRGPDFPASRAGRSPLPGPASAD